MLSDSIPEHVAEDAERRVSRPGRRARKRCVMLHQVTTTCCAYRRPVRAPHVVADAAFCPRCRPARQAAA